MVQEAMDAFDEEAKDSTWQTQVDRLRDIGVSMVGEPVRVWDDVVDGMGFTGWKRGLATRLEEGRGRGEGVMGERGGVGREWEWVPRGLRPRAPGVENLRPVER